ncbi:hypothetical protein [Aquabacterium sp.]|uniref:hypothetical protein n=1 Tax=Aquabacterium sp. TaxID=1872578 RepID=UPI002CE0D377|nr:hypothetical protein [Aquabacterium sp.]HSW07843.1 hypothetical protein [Aquabacterium sp.]
MTIYGITHRRLAVNGAIAAIRCQVVDGNRNLVGPAQQFTALQAADLIDGGEAFELWPRVGAARVFGGAVQVRREPDGTPRLVEERAGGRQLLDLPGF